MEMAMIGEPVLRTPARTLSTEEIQSVEIQQTIAQMYDTMRSNEGVGLAGPQVGLPLQLVVIEDKAQASSRFPAEHMVMYERKPIPFHAIINPVLTVESDETVEYFEACLSVGRYAALVSRARFVRVECLNEAGQSITIRARGWYARILQHEIDHLRGTLFVDSMVSRSFTTFENMSRYWLGRSIDEVKAALSLS